MFVDKSDEAASSKVQLEDLVLGIFLFALWTVILSTGSLGLFEYLFAFSTNAADAVGTGEEVVECVQGAAHGTVYLHRTGGSGGCRCSTVGGVEDRRAFRWCVEDVRVHDVELGSRRAHAIVMLM